MATTNAKVTAGHLAQGLTGAEHIGDPVANLSGAQFNEHVYLVNRPALRGAAKQQVTGVTGPEENPYQVFTHALALSAIDDPDHSTVPHYVPGDSGNENN